MHEELRFAQHLSRPGVKARSGSREIVAPHRRGVERIGELLGGTVFRDSVPATEDETKQQKLAA